MPQPLLYGELAEWWPLVSPREDYAEEAGRYADLLAADGRTRTVLELGSGGGHTASWLRERFAMTLLDLSPRMLAQSRALNPGCEHVEGDMRDVRLGRTFDAVFVHDAVMHVTRADDLARVMATAAAHCVPGGVALFVPDCIRETFAEGIDTGGADGEERSLRYLEWCRDPDPTDTEFVADVAWMLREGTGPVRVVHDRLVYGLFSRAEWIEGLAAAGFAPEVHRIELSDAAKTELEVFRGVRVAT